MGRQGGGRHGGFSSHSSGGHHHHGGPGLATAAAITYVATGGSRGPCKCLGTLLCLLFLGAIVAAIVGVASAPDSFYYDDPAMSATEQALYQVDTEWHDAIVTKAVPAVAVSYKFSSRPPIIPNNKTWWQYKETSSVAPDEWSMSSAYLLTGSYASVYVSPSQASSNVVFCAIKGESNYRRFCNGEYPNCISKSTYLPATLSFNVYSDDEYFFVVDNKGWTTLGLDWTFSLNKTFYDVSQATEVCKTETCRFKLKHDDECVVVEIPAAVGKGNYISVKVWEEANTDTWWTIFGSISGVLGGLFLLSCFCAICCRKKKHQDASKEPLLPSAAIVVPIANPEPYAAGIPPTSAVPPAYVPQAAYPAAQPAYPAMQPTGPYPPPAYIPYPAQTGPYPPGEQQPYPYPAQQPYPPQQYVPNPDMPTAPSAPSQY